jgi:hypothetical protein
VEIDLDIIPGLPDLAFLAIIMLVVLLLCGYCSKGGQFKTYVYRKTPRADEVDSIGGSRHLEDSYIDPSGRKGPLPIGFSTTPEREKPETYEIHRSKHADDAKKETEE